MGVHYIGRHYGVVFLLLLLEPFVVVWGASLFIVPVRLPAPVAAVDGIKVPVAEVELPVSTGY